MGNEGLLAGLACRAKSRDGRAAGSNSDALFFEAFWTRNRQSLHFGQAVGRLLGILGEYAPRELLSKVFGSVENNGIWVLRAFWAQARALSIDFFWWPFW